MVTVTQKEVKRIHPHKFMLWIAIGSICMMFAGFTSAYIVKKNQDNFLPVDLPITFWYSTGVILLSSLTIHLAYKAFKAREMMRYRRLITITALLGLVFAALQAAGFLNLQSHGIALVGARSNPSASFLLVIIGVHALHVLGGVIALLVMFFKAYRVKTKTYSAVPIELASTYWHFVDILWIYLLVFFMWIR